MNETLKIVADNYGDEYSDYFAAISKGVFLSMALGKKDKGKITLQV